MLTPPFVPIILITCVWLWETGGGGTVHSTQRVCCTKTSVICCTQTSTFSFQRRLFNKKHDHCNNRSNNSLLLIAHGHKRLYAVRRLKKKYSVRNGERRFHPQLCTNVGYAHTLDQTQGRRYIAMLWPSQFSSVGCTEVTSFLAFECG